MSVIFDLQLIAKTKVKSGRALGVYDTALLSAAVLYGGLPFIRITCPVTTKAGPEVFRP